MESKAIRVLLIEDDLNDARFIKILLSKIKTQRYFVEHVDRVGKGIEQLSAEEFDVILLDLHLPDSAGLDTVKTVIPHTKQVPVVVFTAMGDFELATKAIQEGAQDYLVKDTVESDLLGRTIRYSIERKQISETLREERDKAQLYLDIAKVIMVVIDASGIVTLVNKRGCEVLGLAEKEILGKNWFENFVPEPWRPKVKSNFSTIFSEGKKAILDNDTFILSKGSDERLISWKYSTLVDKQQRVTGILCSGEDITEQKIAQEKMYRARNRAEFFNDLLIHDVAKLVQTIEWAYDAIHERLALTEEDKRASNSIQGSIARARTLLDKVERFSKVDNFSSPLTEVDVHVYFENAVGLVTKSFPKKQLHIESNIRPGVWKVLGNDFLFDIFENLVSNILKFSESNDVQAEINASEAENPSYIRVNFKDFGPGIPDSQKLSLFTRLVKYEGRLPHTGVGLTLVDRIIEQYGGKIWVENRVQEDYSKGSIFVVLLPRPRQAG